MPYSTQEDVREAAGGIEDEEDLSNDDIDFAIAAADVIIDNATGRTWDSTEKSYPLVKEISLLFAASFVMDKFDDPKDEGKKNYDKAKELLGILVSGDEFSSSLNIAITEYKTSPLNPDAKIGRGRLAGTGLKGEDAVDPDEIYNQEF